jgi:hypothetical protein
MEGSAQLRAQQRQQFGRLHLLTLTRLRDGLGLRPGRMERAISRRSGEGRYNAAIDTMPEGLSTGESLTDEVSVWLRAWTDGDQRALARITPIVYDERHGLAHHYLKRERKRARAWLYRELAAPTAHGH